jgi:hypothetical protein
MMTLVPSLIFIVLADGCIGTPPLIKGTSKIPVTFSGKQVVRIDWNDGSNHQDTIYAVADI